MMVLSAQTSLSSVVDRIRKTYGVMERHVEARVSGVKQF